MLLANKKVAEMFLKQKNKQNIYRVHDQPDEEKLIALERIIKNLGYKNRFGSYKNLHHNINDLLKKQLWSFKTQDSKGVCISVNSQLPI